MTCPITGLACPITGLACLGLANAGVCDRHAKLTAWRAVPRDEQFAQMAKASDYTPPAIDPSVRDAVLACPDRGPEGGAGVVPEGCCGGGAELTACRAGRGKIAGKVTLRECLACKS